MGHVGGFAGRKIGLIKKKDKSGKEVLVATDESGNIIPESELPEGYSLPAGQVSQPTDMDGTSIGVPAGGVATTLPPGMGSAPSAPGTLIVTVLSAKDLKSKEGNSAKPYVVLRGPGKTQKIGHHKTGHVKGLEPEWCVG